MMGISRHVPPPEPLRIFHATPSPGQVVRDVGVIIVAAGESTRTGGGELKQFRWIAGKPMLAHSVQAFLARRDVCSVVCVLPRKYVADPPPWLLQGDLDRMLLSTGGAVRMESVRNGLEDLVPEARVVLVHDAARPFVSDAMIDRVIASARQGRATIPAIPVVDTLKERSDTGEVIRTVPRERLWRAQTPQGFPRELIERAHREGSAMSPATDDAALVEALGVPVHIVLGDERAMKITDADDFPRAEALFGLPPASGG
jgi:2-C-methyl-D-erythritol 4-phosphate cytidylyltransferase